MIAQARITSDTTATVHLSDETVQVTGADLAEIRNRVKQVFITAARSGGVRVDVVIVEPDVRHHLRVEPTGRIVGRASDGRPLYGPPIDAPLIAPADEPLPTNDTVDLSSIDRALLARPGAGPRTGEHAAVSTDTGELRAQRARRRRAAQSPSSSASAASPASPSRPVSTSRTSAAGSSASPARSAVSAPSPSSPQDSLTNTDKRPLPPRAVSDADGRPTLQDLQTSTSKPEKVKATRGFPGFITRLSGGSIAPRPNRRERRDTERLEQIRRPLEGPRNIAVVNLKGGAHKTTASLMIAATLGVTRGGNVLAWDNNETRGTLGWRGIPSDHPRTAVDLLHDIDKLRAPDASNADLDPYVRPQGEMRFDILASDEDPGSAASIDDTAFGELNDALSRFYRIKVIDTGNNVRASNWLAAVRSADQLVIVSTVREDTFNAAAWMIDELRATGLAKQVDHAVTILSHSSKGKFDKTLRSRLLAHFGAHTRAVCEVPYEQQFVDGTHMDWGRISPQTKEAWLDATAEIIEGL